MAEITEDQIRERAYEIWQREGYPEGREHEHWLQAHRELLEESVAGGGKRDTSRSKAAEKAVPAKAGAGSTKARAAAAKPATATVRPGAPALPGRSRKAPEAPPPSPTDAAAESVPAPGGRTKSKPAKPTTAAAGPAKQRRMPPKA